ncbi:hypothetical protein MM236_19375, partial [Belliella sp. DSM 107340]|nr:hypothetical protein [Belliella calami]
MKRLLLLILFVVVAGGAMAQVGIGTQDPSSSAQLEIVSADKGILIPRIALGNTTDQNTITSGNEESLLVYNTTDNDSMSPGYYYWYNDRWRRILWGGVGETANNIVVYDPNNNRISYTDSEGEMVSIDIQSLLNETLTLLIDNNDGTYTYYNEESIDLDGNPTGAGITIDVPESVVSEFQTIIDNTQVRDILNQFITENVAGNVTFDGTDFSYVNEDGDVETINLSEIVKANETITLLLDTSNGTYTYYNEESIDSDGNPIAPGVLIDIPSAVISEFETIIQDGDVRELLSTFITENV